MTAPSRGLALAGLTVSVLCATGSLALIAASGRGGASIFFADPLRDAVVASGLVVYAVVGTLVIWRHPRHVLGWLLIALGVAFSAFVFTGWYATYGLLTHPGSLAGADLAGWLVDWIWTPAVVLFGAVLLVFPSGRLLSPKWRTAVWLLILAFAVDTVAYALGGNARFELPASRPFGHSPEWRGAQLIGDALLAAAILSSIVALFLRVRRSRGAERQQLKWLGYAGGVVLAGLLYALVVSVVEGPRAGATAAFPWALGINAIPVAAGIAILRYRLYDIDVLIRRTLVYATVSALLLGTYIAAVVLTGAALRPFTAGSDLAVAVSTLLVVALFQPIRTRVQEIVDRRFYRARYDAARTLDAFSARLRNEVDLESVRSDLVGVVAETVRPAHTSLWLR